MCVAAAVTSPFDGTVKKARSVEPFGPSGVFDSAVLWSAIAWTVDGASNLTCNFAGSHKVVGRDSPAARKDPGKVSARASTESSGAGKWPVEGSPRADIRLFPLVEFCGDPRKRLVACDIDGSVKIS
ncbi:hypothetical protein JMUB6875_42340 [Nocardia sp. JMUB6875]